MSEPTFYVEKLRPGRWQILRVDGGRTIGNRLGIFDNRREALATARLLAGWRGRVVLFKAARKNAA